ncbi:MAG TPA: GNAT family N-acetyltransferase [Candidatus Dormibacteraeota bacterium]|nr:GNAT family N-acetyltransferase [Candidatus Dormibacteraeota bacterium]
MPPIAAEPGAEIEVTDPGAWDALVRAAPAGELYHTTAWLDHLAKTYGVEVVRLGVVRGGELVGGLPLLLRRVGPFLLAGSPLTNVATPQMGPLHLDQDGEAEVLAAFDRFQRRRGVGLAEIIYGQPGSDDALAALGYRVSDSLTLVVDLRHRSVDDLWRGFEGRSRTAIRKAEREGVTVEVAEDPVYIDEYVRMAGAVYGRQRRPPPIPAAFYRDLWDRFAASGVLRPLVARHQGRTIAAALFLIWGGRVYYQDGAGYPEHNHLGANNLIQWELLKWAVGQGLDSYDMVGAGLPAIARFKASFGGVLVRRPLARRTNSPSAAAALEVYRRAAPLGRRLRWRLRAGIGGEGRP